MTRKEREFISSYNLKESLKEIQVSLPKKQKKLCHFIINNIDQVSTMTIQELSDKSGVGTTTILRLINKMGYKKYPHFKNDVIKYNFNTKDDTWWHLKKSLEEMDDAKNSLIKVGKSSIEDIESIMKEYDAEEYDTFLKLLLNAENVHFLGMRTSKSLALYFEMMLRGILDNLNQLSLNSDFIYDESLKFKEGDVLMVIALSPYSKQTIDFVTYCRDHMNINIAVITDLETCPLIQTSDAHLIAKQSNDRYSIVPAITLMESLIIDLGKRKPDSVEKISRLNRIHRENNITTS
ncbi:DNA-binding transcriptional regulator, MurR/RpiR family, contains HTH and SIS domains [Lentibacillus persicus]|uniref:DNA-binding transcriptional regulator, MurR/RpiR family, contains HTH and SIS domains n=1 Tax=Lentibacillus persicus TaxID=640948 RepID=A0A1I1WAN9_9BACI|nr:MurR/RpiR family transcriptional regulator [Lentibacillus persicus]SFD90473.1 DNA-binding transcriptional regulator, MurR/RpiR family, contains HTH and SIS domains [Lentibacillus persicus]